MVVTILGDAGRDADKVHFEDYGPTGRSSALKIDVATVLVLEMFAAFFGFGMYLAHHGLS